MRNENEQPQPILLQSIFSFSFNSESFFLPQPNNNKRNSRVHSTTQKLPFVPTPTADDDDVEACGVWESGNGSSVGQPNSQPDGHKAKSNSRADSARC
ncbi:hypothetical protein ACLKA7_012306 [Drosophila subpalustris]